MKGLILPLEWERKLFNKNGKQKKIKNLKNRKQIQIEIPMHYFATSENNEITNNDL